MRLLAKIKRWIALKIDGSRIAQLEKNNAILIIQSECIFDQLKLARNNNASLREALNKPCQSTNPSRDTVSSVRAEVENLIKNKFAKPDQNKRKTKKRK